MDAERTLCVSLATSPGAPSPSRQEEMGGRAACASGAERGGSDCELAAGRTNRGRRLAKSQLPGQEGVGEGGV